MTVSSSTVSTVGQGNGVTTSFNYNFLIPASSEVSVSYTDPTGITTALGSSQYAISGIGNAQGGTIIYPLAGSPIPVGGYITITRNLQLLQLVSISNQGAFYPSVVESALDYLMMCIQQVSAKIGGTPIPAPITMKQMKQALINTGVFYTISNAIPANPGVTLNVAWWSAFISPGDTLSAFIQSTLGYSNTQMTALYAAAALLPQ